MTPKYNLRKRLLIHEVIMLYVFCIVIKQANLKCLVRTSYIVHKRWFLEQRKKVGLESGLSEVDKAIKSCAVDYRLD